MPPEDYIIQLLTVPPPVVDISVADGTAEPMSIAGIVVSLLGSATLDPTVDSEVTVKGVWTQEGSPDILASNESTSSPFVTSLTFDPLALSDRGVYVFTVTVNPSNPMNIMAAPSVNVTYALNPLPYPDLVIEKAISFAGCGGNGTAILSGSVDLLPNTANNHNVTYTWTDPALQSRHIAESSGNVAVNNETLVVHILRDNILNYNLTVCLTVLGTDVVDHCTTAEFFISTDGNDSLASSLARERNP